VPSRVKIGKSSAWRPFSDFLLKLSDWGGKLYLTAALPLLGLYRWRAGKVKEDYEGFFVWFSMNTQTLFAFILILLLFCLSLNEQLRKKSLKALESELRAAKDQLNEFGDNIENLFNGFLSGLASKMGFEAATKARFSIYLSDKDNAYFFPCGRYSPDPELKRKGRTKFTREQGCIWKAWLNGFHFDHNAPSGEKAYQSYQLKTYKIPDNELKSLKMRPRLICGKRIEDPSGDPIGVIICEAVEPTLFSEDNLRNVLGPASDDLSKMLSSLQEFIPNPNHAGDVGL